jgi:hypothetical protein
MPEMHIDRAAGRAAPFGFVGFALSRNKIKALRHLQEVNNGADHCCGGGRLFPTAAQRIRAQHVNGVLQTAGCNNRLVRDGNTYPVN